MPNAFELFGEIKVDTSRVQRSLHDLDTRLNRTEKSIADTEKRAASLGRTTATSARQFEKMTDSVRANRDRMNQALSAYEKGQISQSRLASVLRQTDARVTSLNSRLKDHAARLTDIQGKTGSWLQSLSRFNTHIALAGAVVAGFAVKAGMNLEDIRNKFIAIEGSADLANKRIEKLKALARGNVGVTIGDAAEAFSFLRQLKVGESSIDGITKALGRLKLGFGETMQSSTDFLINMQQLFDQGFEAQDIKQAIGRVPIFETLMEKAFGTKDPEKLKEMKAAGKLTLDTWMAGIAEAVNTNESLKRLQETTSTKLGKIFDEINFSTGGLTEQFLQFIRPELDRALQAIQSQDYSAAGDAIGKAIGKSIGVAMRGALEAEVGGAGSSSLFRNFGEGILEGFNADSATAVIKTFFNKIGAEVARGLIELNALAVNATPGGQALKLTDSIMESMGFTVDESNSGIKMINSYFKEQLAAVEENYSRNAIDILKASKDAADKIANDQSVSEAIRANAKQRSEALQQQMTALMEAAAKAAETQGVEQAKRSMDSVLEKVPQDASGKAEKGGMSIGQSIATGMAIGIGSGQSSVIGAAIDLATRAYEAAKNALGIHSPSKKFEQIGKDVAQGFINGITAMRASVHAAMADLVDVRNVKGLTKQDAPMVGLIRDLIQEYNELNPLTAKQAMLADMEAGKYGKVNKELREMALKLRERIDLMKQIADRNEKLLQFRDNLSGSGIAFPDFSMFQAEGEGTGLFDALEKEIEAFETEWDLLVEKMGTPPPIDPWGTFWGGMQHHLQRFKDSLPSMKEALGTNLIQSIEGIGNVFAGAISYWDGTAQDFFKNLARGFAQMAQQIIAELTRIMVMKAVMQIIGGFAGAFGGGAQLGSGSLSGLGAGSNVFNLPSGFASGGMVRGTGSSTSDSIAAMLSNGEFVMSAKAVKKWGVGFMERLNSGFQSATPSFAGGGYVGATTNDYSSSWAPTIIVNVPQGNSNPSAVKVAAEQGARQALQVLDRQRRRSK